jgi:VanZ family protein
MGERVVAMGSPQQSRLREWVPIFIWAAMIFTFSTSGFSADSTARVISPILKSLLPGITPAALDLANSLIRKAAHFTEYGILFWLLIKGPLKGRPVLAMALCVGYALTDEGHQLFVVGRTASIYDVALDSTGAMFGGFLCAAISEIL